MDAGTLRLVLSRPIPDKLIEALTAAPLMPPHHFENWMRNGGRVTWRRDGTLRVRMPSRELNRRQIEALRLMAEGKTIGQAAAIQEVKRQSFTSTMGEVRWRLGAETTEQAMVIAHAKGIIESPNVNHAVERLTPTERQALAMFYEAASAQEIAEAMSVAENTAKGFLRRARRKLAARSTAEAARLAFGR